MDADRVTAAFVGGGVPGGEAVDEREAAAAPQASYSGSVRVGGTGRWAASRPKPATSRPPGRRAAASRATTAASVPGVRRGRTLPAATTTSKSAAMPSAAGSNAARSARKKGRCGASALATSSMEASRSTPTQSYPSSASLIMTRPVPQPASSTRAPAGARAAQKAASPCTSFPLRASASKRAAYALPVVPPVSSCQRLMGPTIGRPWAGHGSARACRGQGRPGDALVLRRTRPRA